MIEIKIDNKAIDGLLNQFKNFDPKDQSSAIHKGFKQAALLVEGRLKENITSRILHVRSGHLRASIGSMVEVDDKGLTAIIGSGVRQGDRLPYADIQETGGTIRPRIRQFLTIPLDAAKTSSGVTRFSADDVRRGATKYTGSFIRNHIIFGKSGKSITPLFLLKKSVDIPASHYQGITAEETAKAANDAVMNGVKDYLESKGKT